MTVSRAIVTGASSGIGAHTAHALLQQGYEVINVSLEPPAASSPGIRTVLADLCDPHSARDTFAQLAQEGAATTLVHCAGAIRERPLEEVTAEDLDALSRLHAGAAVALVQANLPAMKAAHFGRIVLVTTRAVLGLARRTAYSSSKAGLIALARTWALELAPYGITSNCVAPGPIADTAMFHDLVPRGSERLAALARAVPVGRTGTPADVARAIMFFVNPEASFITGQTLFVCGGTSVGSLSF
ncbi:MAG: SDR family oxidoreductase [Proteobacteria bacterium]|nr:SDR family oxidoreductase [Pseudomonadota bacterium]